jgi:hypothetical protein
MGYRVPVMLGRKPRQEGTSISSDVGTDLNTSSGGTPWRAKVGSVGRGRVSVNTFGLRPADKDYDTPFGDTPGDDAMINRTSQSVRDIAPQNTQDRLIYKDKRAWYHHSKGPSLPVNIGAWDQSGPAPMSLRLKTFAFRDMAGWSGQRNEGLHTNIAFSPRTLPGRRAMTVRPQNRLTVARYRGQSYSSTTEVLGAR